MIPSVKVSDLTLTDLKDYLRVDFDHDDKFINTLIVASQSFIQTYLGKKFTEFDEVPDEFTVAACALIAHWYENRKVEEEGARKELSYIFSGILDIHREWLGDS